MTTSTKLGTQKIIYQTTLFTPLNSFMAMFIGLLHVIFIAVAFTDDTPFTIETAYEIPLSFLALWLYVMAYFKRFTLTENEFIVEYPPLALVFKPARIPLNDIQKLVFRQAQGKGLPSVEIYRANPEQNTGFQFFTASEPNTYSFGLDYDDVKRLIEELKSKGVQVECIGVVWGKGGVLKQLWKKHSN